MLGEGEGLELLGVFFTFMLGLTVMVVLGRLVERDRHHRTRTSPVAGTTTSR